MGATEETKSELALFGGVRAVTSDPGDTFAWPIVTEEHERAVLEVLRSGRMSGLDVTRQFEKRYAEMLGRKYALAGPNGTAAILDAMYGLAIGPGDEVICPSITYWASIVQAYVLGAAPVFADVDPDTLCIEPQDFERRITPRTKAVVVVHYAGMPAEMDAIMAIASEHKIKVLEDCSHAHGALYRGKEVGTFGAAAAFSLMTGKSLPIGEGGILLTDDRRIYERALLYSHYARHDPGIRPMRPEASTRSTKGGWYYPHFKYIPEELGGLSLSRFSAAVRAEGSVCNPGCNKPLHGHPLFTKMDVYGHGRPTRIAHLNESARIEDYAQSLPVAERMMQRVFEVPWFKHDRRAIIEEHAAAYRKVA